MPDQVRQHKILAASLSLPKTEPPLSNSMVAVLLHLRDPASSGPPVSLVAPAAHLSRVSDAELGYEGRLDTFST
jgi:hypothetical protein